MKQKLNLDSIVFKKPESKEIDVDKAVKSIHTEGEKEPLKRIDVNVPKSLYVQVKKHCVEQDTDMTKFIISLINSHFRNS